MSYHIFGLGEQTALAVSAPIVKAYEREDFLRAVELVAAANTLATQTAADAKARGEAGYQEGYSQGLADANAHIAASIADLSARFETLCAARSNDVAEAALAATRAIIGSFDNEMVIKGLVTQAINRIDTSAPLNIEVAPDVATQLVAHVAHLDTVSVEANAALAPLDCILRTPTGRILAGLELQLSALADRWGAATPTDAVAEPAL